MKKIYEMSYDMDNGPDTYVCAESETEAFELMGWENYSENSSAYELSEEEIKDILEEIKNSKSKYSLDDDFLEAYEEYIK